MLSGVRIVDLTQMLTGPCASMLLADLGAEVLKIEDPQGDDPTRWLRPPFVEGESGYFISINGNKRSVALELRKRGGRQVLYDLAKVSDVVFNNFRPGTMEKLGCTYHTLKEINSQIIYCSLTGFGETGPYRDRPASDPAIPIGELSGSLFCASAISPALYARQKTGAGSRIDIGLVDCMLSLLTYVGRYRLINGKVSGPMGSTHRSVVQYETSATPDVYIVGAVLVDKFWRAFRQVLGVEEMSDDPRFAHNEGRREHREELSPILVDIFRTKAGDEWLRLPSEAVVPCRAIDALDGGFSEPQMAPRGMSVEIDHTKGGRLRPIGNPMKTSAMEEHLFEPALCVRSLPRRCGGISWHIGRNGSPHCGPRRHGIEKQVHLWF